MRLVLYTCAVYCTLCAAQTDTTADLLRADKKNATSVGNTCKNCVDNHIVSVDEDFNKLKADPELNKHVSEILHRLKTFKIPVHPRIRIFYELLKIAMAQYAHRTADSLYVPDKYNIEHNTL